MFIDAMNEHIVYNYEHTVYNYDKYDLKSTCIPLGNWRQNWKTEERNGDRYRENENQYINMEAGFF